MRGCSIQSTDKCMCLHIISVVFFGGMAIGIAFGIAHVGGTLIQVSPHNT